MIVSGSASDATQVRLQDASGSSLAWTDAADFRLAASASTAVSLSAIDAGANQVLQPVACP
jgi:hypothetical protein